MTRNTLCTTCGHPESAHDPAYFFCTDTGCTCLTFTPTTEVIPEGNVSEASPTEPPVKCRVCDRAFCSAHQPTEPTDELEQQLRLKLWDAIDSLPGHREPAKAEIADVDDAIDALIRRHDEEHYSECMKAMDGASTLSEDELKQRIRRVYGR